MRIKDVAKIQSVVDELNLDNNGDLLVSTMEQTVLCVEDFCNKNIEGFSARGEVRTDVIHKGDEVVLTIEVFMDGKELDMDDYTTDMEVLLGDVNNNIGWDLYEE